MSEEKSTEPTNIIQANLLNIFENDEWIIPKEIWEMVIKEVDTILTLPDNGKQYKAAFNNEFISSQRYLFSIVLYILKNNLEWSYVDQCRYKTEHNLYKKINMIIKSKFKEVILESEENIKYEAIKKLSLRMFPSTSQVSKFFTALNEMNIFNKLFYNGFACKEPFLGLDWYCAEGGLTPVWKIRYKSRKRKSRVAE